MPTITILIGNSDDKLTQREWAQFIQAVENVIVPLCDADARTQKLRQHFTGGSPSGAPWQNYCWVFEREGESWDDLHDRLADVARRFRQDSIALLIGDTRFIRPEAVRRNLK